MSEMSLPEHWKTEKLGQLCRVFSGYSFKTKDYTKEGIPLIKIGNLQDGKVVINPDNNYIPESWQQNEKLQRFILKSEDLLIALTGMTGKTAVVKPNLAGAFLNQRVGKIELISPDAEQDFILVITKTRFFQEAIQQNTFRSVQGNISPSSIAQIPIPLPPLREQCAIAGVLQAIQEAKAVRQYEIELEQERKVTLMSYLFSYGTKGEPRKQTEIGEIPESWEVAKLGEITEIIMGQSPKGDTYNTDGEGEPLINGPAEFGSEYPTPVQWTSKPTKLCKDGDILFCVRGNTTGRMNIADQRYCIGRGIAAIRERIQKSSTLFIRNLLEYERSSLYRIAIGGGSTFPNISTAHLKNYTIALPSISEQSQIAEILQAFGAKIAALEKEAERLYELFHAMLDELMTGQRSAVPLIDSELPN